jgi:hypothetical protein
MANVNILGKPYSSPAIARRKRGRPPKPVLPKKKRKTPAQSKVIYHDDTDEDDQPEEHIPPPTGRTTRRSRLAEQVYPEPEPTLATEEQNVDAMDVIPLDESQVETDATTAEQYILSHLANAGVGVDEVDSSTFAEFLPEGVMRGLSGEEEDAGGTGDIDPSLHDQQNELGREVGGDEGTVIPDSSLEGESGLKNVVPGTEQPPSVLSRLRRGAPGSCDICGRTETSVWRRLTLGNEDHKVCNGE